MQRAVLRMLFVILLLFGCAGIRFGGSFNPSDRDWITYGGSAQRAHFTASDIEPPFEEVWTYDAQGGILATPLVRDDVLIVTTLHGEIQLVSLKDGKRIGYVSLDGPIRGTPVLSNLNVIIPVESEEGSVVYFGLREGRQFWRANLGAVASSPLLFDERVVVSTLKGELIALDRANGERIWRFAPSNMEDRKPFRSSPLRAGELVVCGNDDGHLYAVRMADGTPVWTTDCGSPIFASPIMAGGLVIAASIEGHVCAVDASSGKVVWQRKGDAPVYATPSSDGMLVIIADAGGAVTALEASSGRAMWQWHAQSVVNAPALVSQRFVYVGSLDKTLTVLDKRTGDVRWQKGVEGRIKVPVVTWNDHLILVFEDKTIMALRPAGS